MDSGGGFLLGHGTGNRQEASHREHDDGPGESSSSSSTTTEVRKLTQKQELRLMTYLDDAFLELNRNYAKRLTESKQSSNVITLDAYIVQMERILGVIASIPPIGASASLLVNYLLRFTSEFCDGVQGYSVQANEEQRSKQLENLVRSLDVLDRVWTSVLRGQKVNLQAARSHAEQDASASTLVFPGRLMQDGPNADQDSDRLMNGGRYSNASNKDSQRVYDSQSFAGSRGFATVGQTHRIRLRNVVTLAKENLFTWMRVQLNAPLPPEIEQSEQERSKEQRELFGLHGDVNDDLAREVEDDDIALEDVQTTDASEARREDEQDEEESNEQRHFKDLFARTVDPDASDDEGDASDNSEGEARRPEQRKRRLKDARDHNAKRQHMSEKSHEQDGQDEQETTTLNEPTEAESEATFNNAAGPNAVAVMRWDVAFAHSFARTLRCLSDIHEYYERKSSNSDAAGTD